MTTRRCSASSSSRARNPTERSAFMKFNTRLTSMTGTPLFAGILDKMEDLDDGLILLKTANKAASESDAVFPVCDRR